MAVSALSKFIGPVQWSELSDTMAPADMQFGRDETRMALTGDTDFANISNGTAVKAILGFSTRTGTGLINRIPPMKCPLNQWLYATKITSAKGLTPLGNDTKNAYPVPFGKYSRVRLTVLFETLPYDVLDNAAYAALGYTDEFYRWTLRLPYANVETIIRPGNTFSFANGPTTVAFPQGLIVRAQKRDLVVKWFQVPALSVLQPTVASEPWNFEPRTIAETVGCVNNATWHGYRRGEVLLKPSRVEPMNEPVPPEVLGLAPGSVPRCYNIEFHFQVFQPTYDPVVLAANGYETFGHQTAPDPRTRVGSTPYFYQLSRNGVTGLTDNTQWLYPEKDFSNLFKSL